MLKAIGGRLSSQQEKSNFENHSNQKTYVLQRYFFGTFRIGLLSSLHIMLIDYKPWTIGGGNVSYKGANIASKIAESFSNVIRCRPLRQQA